jgi:SAM-dependent methyltransferase
MNNKAYEQYLKESDNWLHKGRRSLLEICISTYCQSLIKKGTQRKILEIGAGSGSHIELLSKYGDVDAVEINPIAIQILKKNKNLQHLYPNSVPFALNQKYDIICAMDFLEHVKNDKQVFNWMIDHLNDNGIIFITVPAFQALFSFHDIALGHYRRYRLERLVKLGINKMTLVKKGYFNFFLFPIAIISRIIESKKTRINKVQIKQSSGVPFLLDKLFFIILQTEIYFIRKYSLFPYGLTAFALFKKNCARS